MKWMLELESQRPQQTSNWRRRQLDRKEIDRWHNDSLRSQIGGVKKCANHPLPPPWALSSLFKSFFLPLRRAINNYSYFKGRGNDRKYTKINTNKNKNKNKNMESSRRWPSWQGTCWRPSRGWYNPPAAAGG